MSRTDRQVKLADSQTNSDSIRLNLKSNELIHPDLETLLKEVLALIDTDRYSRYQDFESVRVAVADLHDVDRSSVVLTAGSDDGIKMVIDVLTTNSKSIILQVPNYDNYLAYAQLRALTVHELPFGAEIKHAYTVDQFERVLERSDPTLVVISNPNGPTGFTLSLSEVTQLCDLCTQYGHKLLIDECYQAFSHVDHCCLVNSYNNVLVIRSFSKCFGLAGARIASLTGAQNLICQIEKWQPENPVSGAAIFLLQEMILKHQASLALIHKDIASSRSWVTKEIRMHFTDWEPLESGGNFMNIVTRSNAEASRITAYLRSKGIRIRNTSDLPGLSQCIRFTIADKGTMETVLNILKEGEKIGYQ